MSFIRRKKEEEKIERTGSLQKMTPRDYKEKQSSFNKFTIPKRRSTAGDSPNENASTKSVDAVNRLEEVKEGSELYEKLVRIKIMATFKDANFKRSVELVCVRKIHTPQREKKVCLLPLCNRLLQYAQYLAKLQNSHRIEGYGFVEISPDEAELETIVERGVHIGNSVTGYVGEAAKGVYVASHPDMVNLGPWYPHHKRRLLFVKTIVGRSKCVDPDHCYGPPPEYEAHSHRPSHRLQKDLDALLSKQNLHHIKDFLRTLTYHYEYDEKTMLTDFPSTVLPIAVLDMKLVKEVERVPRLYNRFIKEPPKLRSICTGQLQWGKETFFNINLKSASEGMRKLTFTGENKGIIRVSRVETWETVADYELFNELLHKQFGKLPTTSNVIICQQNRNRIARLANYFAISCSNPKFQKYVTNLRVGVTRTVDQVTWFFIPPGAFAAELGFSGWNDLHVVTLSLTKDGVPPLELDQMLCSKNYGAACTVNVDRKKMLLIVKKLQEAYKRNSELANQRKAPGYDDYVLDFDSTRNSTDNGYMTQSNAQKSWVEPNPNDPRIRRSMPAAESPVSVDLAAQSFSVNVAQQFRKPNEPAWKNSADFSKKDPQAALRAMKRNVDWAPGTEPPAAKRPNPAPIQPRQERNSASNDIFRSAFDPRLANRAQPTPEPQRSPSSMDPRLSRGSNGSWSSSPSLPTPQPTPPMSIEASSPDTRNSPSEQSPHDSSLSSPPDFPTRNRVSPPEVSLPPAQATYRRVTSLPLPGSSVLGLPLPKVTRRDDEDLRGYDSPQDARDNEEEEYDPAAPLNESADSVRAPDGRMAEFQNEEPEPNDVASPLSSDDDDEDADFKGLIQLAKQNVSGQQQTPSSPRMPESPKDKDTKEEKPTLDSDGSMTVLGFDAEMLKRGEIFTTRKPPPPSSVATEISEPDTITKIIPLEAVDDGHAMKPIPLEAPQDDRMDISNSPPSDMQDVDLRQIFPPSFPPPGFIPPTHYPGQPYINTGGPPLQHQQPNVQQPFILSPPPSSRPRRSRFDLGPADIPLPPPAVVTPHPMGQTSQQPGNGPPQAQPMPQMTYNPNVPPPGMQMYMDPRAYGVPPPQAMPNVQGPPMSPYNAPPPSQMPIKTEPQTSPTGAPPAPLFGKPGMLQLNRTLSGSTQPQNIHTQQRHSSSPGIQRPAGPTFGAPPSLPGSSRFEIETFPTAPVTFFPCPPPSQAPPNVPRPFQGQNTTWRMGAPPPYFNPGAPPPQPPPGGPYGGYPQ